MHKVKDDEYRTIARESSGLYREKGSKFISLAFPVQDEETIRHILDAVKKEHHDARHHCYAYRLGFSGEIYRINDDGEPSGTAGKPIYGQVLSRELTNVLVIVVRYFGGTKLGVSGLITAYKTAAKDALEQAETVIKTIDACFEVGFDYPRMNEVMRLVKEHNLKIFRQTLELSCKLAFSVRRGKADEVYEKFKQINGATIENLDICL